MAYFRAVNAEFAAEGKPYPIGVYGSGQLLTDLQAAGLVDYYWQLPSTGFTGNANPWPGRDMRQTRIAVNMAGITADLDEAPITSLGWW